jgi:hypothetical protein
MSKDKNCKFEGKRFFPCMGMGAMLDSCNDFGIGVQVAHVINLKTGEERCAGVYYQFTKKVAAQRDVSEKLGGRRKLMFNVCPFCEARVLAEKKSSPPAGKEE